jgi:hypothetical protein
MKNPKARPRDRDLRLEYDFSSGVRGKYASRFAQGTNLVRLEPDLAKVFRDSKAVNRALRKLVGRTSRKRAI